MLSTPLGRLRAIGFIEACSFLLLLLIAMPLKYLAGMPEAVFVVGMAHGVLWVLYLLSVAEVSLKKAWPSPLLLPAWWRKQPTPWISAAFVASVVPAGPFFLESRLRKGEAEKAMAS